MLLYFWKEMVAMNQIKIGKFVAEKELKMKSRGIIK